MQNPPINAPLRLYRTVLYSPDTISPESFAADLAAPNAAPNAAARDIAIVPRLIKIHHAALPHRFGTPVYTLLTNLPSFREFTVHCISWIAEAFLNRETSDALTHTLSREEVKSRLLYWDPLLPGVDGLSDSVWVWTLPRGEQGQLEEQEGLCSSLPKFHFGSQQFLTVRGCWPVLARAVTRCHAPLRAITRRDVLDMDTRFLRCGTRCGTAVAGGAYVAEVTGATRERGASASSRAATLEAVVRAVRSGVKDSGSLGRQYRVSVGSLGTIEKKD